MSFQNKQSFQDQHAHRLIIDVAMQIDGDGKKGLLCQFLTIAGNEIGGYRLGTVLDVFTKSILPGNDMCCLVWAFTKIATLFECQDAKWFMDYIDKIRSRESTADKAEPFSVDQAALILLRQINEGSNTFLQGSNFDQITTIAFIVALAIIPNDRELKSLNICYDTFSGLVDSTTFACNHPEIEEILAIFRLRLGLKDDCGIDPAIVVIGTKGIKQPAMI